MSEGYLVNEIFYSIQGEGGRAGHPSLFLRLAACNLKCSMEPGPLSPGGFACDTEFASGRRMTAEEIVGELIQALPQYLQVEGNIMRGWVVITGGEPLLQVNEELLVAINEAGFRVQVETNGTRPCPWYDHDGVGLVEWLTVSPKVAEHAVAVDVATEVKYVRGHGQPLPCPKVESNQKWISPAFDGDQPDPRAIAWCIRLCKENPEWNLSLQLHKLLRVR